MASVASCAHAGTAIPYPAGFPTNFPVPTGTIFDTKSAITTGKLKGEVEVHGYVPPTNFATTVNFSKNELPRAGFVVQEFEADAPNDSEGQFTGFGKIGRWQLKRIFGCKAMSFAVSAEPK